MMNRSLFLKGFLSLAIPVLLTASANAQTTTLLVFPGSEQSGSGELPNTNSADRLIVIALGFGNLEIGVADQFDNLAAERGLLEDTIALEGFSIGLPTTGFADQASTGDEATADFNVFFFTIIFADIRYTEMNEFSTGEYDFRVDF